MMLPLGLSGGSQVIDILNSEGNVEMTTDPGTTENKNEKHLEQKSGKGF